MPLNLQSAGGVVEGDGPRTDRWLARTIWSGEGLACSVGYHVDWIGRETAQWDAALLDVSAPGMPKLQMFVRGLTAGAPDSASPGLARSRVRPAAPLVPGQLPRTAAAFGGSPESSTIGFDVTNVW